MLFVSVDVTNGFSANAVDSSVGGGWFVGGVGGVAVGERLRNDGVAVEGWIKFIDVSDVGVSIR